MQERPNIFSHVQRISSKSHSFLHSLSFLLISLILFEHCNNCPFCHLNKSSKSKQPHKDIEKIIAKSHSGNHLFYKYIQGIILNIISRLIPFPHTFTSKPNKKGKMIAVLHNRKGLRRGIWMQHFF